MKDSHIIPTVFSKSKRGFEKRFMEVVKISKKIQIDFMDGKFVPAKSVSLEDIPNLKKYRKEFEAHLMVENPREWLRGCKEKGFVRVIFHIETSKDENDAQETIYFAKGLGLQVYVAINPSTSLKKISGLVRKKKCDGILLLGVHPGKEGQKMSSKIPSRVRDIKRLNKKMIVQIDGGINGKNIELVAAAGVDKVNSGSFVSDSKNPRSQMNLLENLFEAGRRTFKK